MLLHHFLKTLTLQYHTGDFDADHPMCLWLVKKYRLDYQQQLWLTILAMAFYNEASAWIAFNRSDPFKVPKDCSLPIDKNRRNLYGQGIKKHLTAVCLAYHQNPEWPCVGFTEDRKANWDRLRAVLRDVWGNGRFAVYNTADMIHKVSRVAVEITDFENRSSSGPADGISRISECDRKSLEALNAAGEDIYQRTLLTKRQPNYTKADRGTVESVLCNFSGMCRGRYYPGRNIDRQQGRITLLSSMDPAYKKLLDPFWDARADIFPREVLGEFNGWEGIDKSRLTVFRDKGVVLCANDQR